MNNIEVLEAEVKEMVSTSELARRLIKVPGLGCLSMPARGPVIGATHQDGATHASSPAALGLEPSHVGTGGKVRMGPISKRGDAYLRTLRLIHGARNLVRTAAPSQWIARMLERRPFNVGHRGRSSQKWPASWAMAAHGREYDPNWLSQAPHAIWRAPPRRRHPSNRMANKLPERVRVDDETMAKRSDRRLVLLGETQGDFWSSPSVMMAPASRLTIMASAQVAYKGRI